MVLSLLSCTACYTGGYLCPGQPRRCLPAEQKQPEPLFQPDRFCAEIWSCHRPFYLHVSHLHHALWRVFFLISPSSWWTRPPELHRSWSPPGALPSSYRALPSSTSSTFPSTFLAPSEPASCDPPLYYS